MLWELVQVHGAGRRTGRGAKSWRQTCLTCREKQPEQGWARAVSTHTARQTDPSPCSDVTPCTALGRKKTHDQLSSSPLHTSFSPSATWQKWMNTPLWLGKWIFDCWRMLQECKVGCYELCVLVLWLTHFPWARQRRGDCVRCRTQSTADIFKPDQSCHILLTAGTQESVSDTHRGHSTLLSLPHKCLTPVTLCFPGIFHLPRLLEHAQKSGIMESC